MSETLGDFEENTLAAVGDTTETKTKTIYTVFAGGHKPMTLDIDGLAKILVALHGEDSPKPTIM